MSSQSKTNEVPRKIFEGQNVVLISEEKVIWILGDDDLLKFGIMIAAHCGIRGHRGYRATEATIRAHFWWNTLAKDVESFVRSCLHCLATETGETVPRLLGHALHADRPNKMTHFDFCYISLGEAEKCYVLIIKDDFSGYVWLTPTSEADAENTADSLLSWFASFGTVTQCISDRGSHFKNAVLHALREQTCSSHNFTLAYSP